MLRKLQHFVCTTTRTRSSLQSTRNFSDISFKKRESEEFNSTSVFRVGIPTHVYSNVCDSRPKPNPKTEAEADTDTDTEADRNPKRIPRVPRAPTSLKREIDQLQAQFPNHVLLVQVGMFYEIYKNVDEIAQILGLRIANNKTRKEGDHCFNRFAGFPTISLKSHLECLVQHGKTVAIANQQKQDPPLSDVIIRKVTRIVTPGTMIDELDSNDKENNYLLSLFSCAPSPKGKNIGMAWLDVSTGEFNVSMTTQAKLADELGRIQPREIILPSSLDQYDAILSQTKALITRKPVLFFETDENLALLCRVIISKTPQTALFAHTPRTVLKGLKPLQIQAASGLLGYVSETFPCAKPAIHSPSNVEPGLTMLLSAKAIQSLEITHTQRDRSRVGSLLSILDKTKTAAGHRLLSARLKAPSTNLVEITERLDMVEIFFQDSYLREKVIGYLACCKDVERALQRIHLCTSAPSDLYSILGTIDQVGLIRKELLIKLEGGGNRVLESLISRLGDLGHLSEQLGNVLNPDAGASNKMTALGTIQEGVSRELDYERRQYAGLLELQQKRAAELSEKFKLKCTLTSDSRFGPVIEIGKTTEKTYDRIQKSLNKSKNLTGVATRTAATKLKDKIWTGIYQSQQESFEKQLKLEVSIFADACDKIKDETVKIVAMMGALAELDFSTSNARLAVDSGLTRPQFVSSETSLEIRGGRHPVVEKYQLSRGNNYVSNDCLLGPLERLVLLTGANMGGKSTFLRQTALIVIIAQTGLYVPACFATQSLVDQIFTRIGSTDDLSANESTFMVEMKEMSFIFENATNRSLIILDEVGRGTSTKDGIAIAVAIIDHIVNKTGAMCIFATHLHELSVLIPQEKIPNVGFLKADCLLEESTDEIASLYKIIPGVMDKSHGIQVAKLAGLPQSVINKAKKFYSLSL